MLSIRENVFESNSSSVHSLTITSKAQYKRWEDGEVVWQRGAERFYTIPELWEIIEKEIKEDTEELSLPDRANDEWSQKKLKDAKVLIEGMTEEIFAKHFQELLKEYEGAIYYDTFRDVNEHSNWWHELALNDRLKTVGLLQYCFGEGLYTEEAFYDYDKGIEYETFCHNENIDGVDVVAFGYYGHD